MGACRSCVFVSLKRKQRFIPAFPNMASGFVVKLDTCLTPPSKSRLKSARHLELRSDGIIDVLQTPLRF